MAYCELRNITIEATPKATRPYVTWGMSENGLTVGNQKVVCDRHQTQWKKKDPHLIVFTLNDSSGLNLRFLKDVDEVMWVGPDNVTCPTGTTAKNKEFQIVSVTNDALTIANKNSKQAELKFVLNFLGDLPDGSTALIPYDPIWGNGNGGSR